MLNMKALHVKASFPNIIALLKVSFIFLIKSIVAIKMKAGTHLPIQHKTTNLLNSFTFSVLSQSDYPKDYPDALG